MDLEQLLKETAERIAREDQQQQAQPQNFVTVDQLSTLLQQQQEAITKSFKDEYSNVGTGRVVPAPTDPREADTENYLIKKSMDPDSFDATDKELISALTKKWLMDGLLA